jgi:ethanolamine ammonia-lyase small subunit
MAETPKVVGVGAADPFRALRAATPARIGLGRAGQGLPTAAMLEFQLAHARACDAVHAALDVDHLQAALPSPSLVVASAAPDRAAYLQNPDLGRRLADGAAGLERGDYDLALVVADGLSAPAVQAHAAPLIRALLARLPDWSLAPVVIALGGRVAIGDPVGEALGARIVAVLIGERPGLSASDSLGVYVTWGPRPGRRDSERNCISNIRSPGGLSADEAAGKLAWLLGEIRRLGFSGVEVKDRREALPHQSPAPLPSAGSGGLGD